MSTSISTPDTHTPAPATPLVKTTTTGRPRANLDSQKDQILALHAAKTPWKQIEATLLAQHGISAHARTIMRCMTEWGVDVRRIGRTDKESLDQLKARIAYYWADRDTRPKTDDELHARLCHDGFRVSRDAVQHLRVEMNLFRRWDAKLGRVRPDEELGKRTRRRRQKHSAFTHAQLVPPRDGGGDDDDDDDDDDNSNNNNNYNGDDSPDRDNDDDDGQDDESESSPQLQPVEPTRDGCYSGPALPKPASSRRRTYGGQQKAKSARPSRPQQVARPAQPYLSISAQAAPYPYMAPQQVTQPSSTLSNAAKDVQIRALLERIHLLEQHCLAHAIGLPPQGQPPPLTHADVHGLQSFAAAVDMGRWHRGSDFIHDGPGQASLR